jgi:hypothetical protein
MEDNRDTVDGIISAFCDGVRHFATDAVLTLLIAGLHDDVNKWHALLSLNSLRRI